MSLEYPKIQSIYKRDEKGHQFLEGQWSMPEFEYLKDLKWEGTEKIDGTNIRVGWDTGIVTFGGHTDEAQIPPFLVKKLQEIFTPDRMKAKFGVVPVTLYGEGYGAKIQSGGIYIPNGCGFILFDSIIDQWWLKRDSLEDIASKLDLPIVPIMGYYKLEEAVELARKKLIISKIRPDGGLAEGLVLKPMVELRNRNGHRLITKIKHKDFR